MTCMCYIGAMHDNWNLIDKECIDNKIKRNKIIYQCIYLYTLMALDITRNLWKYQHEGSVIKI